LRRPNRGPDEDRIPLPNLCNRLVVNEHPWCPTTPEREALTPLTSPSAPSPSPTRMCRRRTASSGSAPNSPKASPTPSGAAIGVACASRGSSPEHPEGHPFRPHLAWGFSQGPPPLSLERRQPARRRCLPLRRPDDEATDASCRAPHPGLAGWRAGREAPRTLSTDGTPMPSLPRPEAPSTDKSLLPCPFAGAEDATSGPPLVPWLGRLGPASDTRSLARVRARSCPRAGYSPESARPRAAHRFLQCMDS
jgi:hypothetical protein